MSKINIRDRNKNAQGKKPNWEYRFEAASINGKRKHITKSGFKTKKEALEAGAKAFTEYILGGSVFSPSEMSFSDYLDKWFEDYCKTNLRYNTQKRYLQMINSWLKPNLGQYKLKSLSPSLLQSFVNDIAKSGYKSKTLVVNFAMMKKIMDYGVLNMQVLRENPFNRVKFPKLEDDHQAPQIITAEDFNTILDSFPLGTRLHIPLNLGMYCGLRKSEIFGVTWDDIDFGDQVLHVNKQLYARSDSLNTEAKRIYTGWYFSRPKYNSSRKITLPQPLIDILKMEKERQIKNEAEFGDDYLIYVKVPAKDEKGQTIMNIIKKTKLELNDNDERVYFVCIDSDGKMVNSNLITQSVKYINDVLGIPFHMHALRHSHATFLIEQGINPRIVADRLGHKDTTTTMKTYLHGTEESQKQMMHLLNTMVNKKP